MVRAFITHIDIGTEDPMSYAEDITDDLIAAGHDVRQTLPWNPEAAATPIGVPSSLVPPPTTTLVPPILPPQF
jgi:hypothetical protein